MLHDKQTAAPTHLFIIFLIFVRHVVMLTVKPTYATIVPRVVAARAHEQQTNRSMQRK